MHSSLAFTAETGAELVIDIRACPISAEIFDFPGVPSGFGEFKSSGLERVRFGAKAETTCICVDTSCAAKLNFTAAKPSAAIFEPGFLAEKNVYIAG